VSSGLAFAVTFSDGGRSVSGERFALRVPGARGPLSLVLDDPQLHGGSFRSRVLLKNETGVDLYGVRVDFASAVETLRGTGGAGGPTRTLTAAAAHPLAWPEVAAGKDTDPQTLDAGPIGFSPETGLVTVTAAVTGIAALAAFDIDAVGGLAGLRTDAAGNLWLTDVSGQVFRAPADGGAAIGVKRAPPAATTVSDGACAPHRAAGHLCGVAPDGVVWVAKGPEVTALDASGATLRTFRPLGDIAPTLLAFGREGRIYFGAGGGEGGRKGAVRGFRVF
jgi:hypothetical protein